MAYCCAFSSKIVFNNWIMNIFISLRWVYKTSSTSFIGKLRHNAALLGLDLRDNKCDDEYRAQPVKDSNIKSSTLENQTPNIVYGKPFKSSSKT